MLFTAIILAKTSNTKIFDMTNECIRSMMHSEVDSKNIEFEVIVIESESENEVEKKFMYGDHVKVIYPNTTFNFHKFLNIGIKAAKGDFIGLFNNDLIFKKNWFTSILEVSERNKKILSFCPVDYHSKFTPPTFFNEDEVYKLGYTTRKHVVGWCIIAKKELFNTMTLDETFDFYYADDDYGMTLKKKHIYHAVVKGSEVTHLENITTKELQNTAGNVFFKTDIKGLKAPKYLIKHKSHILQDRRLLEGHIKFHGKWGTPRTLLIKEKITILLNYFKLDFLNKVLY